MTLALVTRGYICLGRGTVPSGGERIKPSSVLVVDVPSTMATLQVRPAPEPVEQPVVTPRPRVSVTESPPANALISVGDNAPLPPQPVTPATPGRPKPTVTVDTPTVRVRKT